MSWYNENIYKLRGVNLFDLNIVIFNFDVIKEDKKRAYECVLNDYAIYRDGKPIDMKTELVNHSPMGLAWGYHGSSCSQAALAVLCDFTKDEEFSLKVYMDFKDEIMSTMPEKNCHLKFSDVQKWVELKKHTIKTEG